MIASFGDNVVIADTQFTRELGFAGERGSVYGVTKPSSSGVEVIGETPDDVALNIHFEGRGRSFWFAPDLVQFVDHGAGIEVRLDGVNKKWVRRNDGGWDEIQLPPPPPPKWP